MSEIHQFKCESCATAVNANYNGEHYLPPDGWHSFYCAYKAKVTDAHLCEICSTVSLSLNLRETKLGKKLVKETK